MTPTNMPCKLTFVPYEERFLERSFVWFQDAELRELTNTPTVTREKQVEWFAALPAKSDYLIWGICLGDEPVGACGLKKVTTQDAEYWGYIGEKSLWGRGLGRQMISFCIDETKKLNLSRVWLTVNANNLRAIALYRKMGFHMIKQDNGKIEMETIIRAGIDACCMVDLPKISDPRGSLTFIENNRHVPFDIRRVYYLYDVPGGAERGGHAHKDLHQLIIAMSGSFDVVLDDGREKKCFHLARSYYGLYVCPMMWRELTNFSSGSVCMVLASNLYDESDYYRDYAEFQAACSTPSSL